MKGRGVRSLAAFCLLFAIVLSAGIVPVLGGGFIHTSNGPYGGVVQAMTIGADGTLYAAPYKGWVYTSPDQGANWSLKKLYIPNSARNIRALAASSLDPVYAGSDSGGVFRLPTPGGTWAPINSGLPNLHIKSLLVDTATPTTVYAGTEGSGVYEWQDPGPWQAKNNGALTAIPEALAQTANGTLYMGRTDDGTEYGVYYWDGATWQARNAGLPANTTVLALLADGNNLWAGTEGQGVYYWNGSTWSARNTGLPVGDARIVRSLGRDGTGQIYAGTDDGLYYWTGSQWAARDSGLEGNGRHVNAIVSPGGSDAYIGTDGRGVFKTTDGGVTWTDVNEGLTGHLVRAVAINPQYDWRVYAGTYRGGVYRSTNGGLSWNWWSEGLGDVEVQTLAVTYPSGNPIYTGLGGQGVYRRDRLDEFNTWTDWLPKNTGLSGSALIVNALVVKPNDSTQVFAGTEGGVYRSLTSGDAWEWRSTGLPYAVTALAIDPVVWDTVYAGTNLNGVFVTYNDGAQWTPLGSLPGDAAKVFALTIDTADNLYAGTADGVYSYSGGAWQQDGLAETEIHTLVTNPLSQTVLYGGTAEGLSPLGIVKKTPDGWEPMITGLQNLNVYALSIDDYYTQTLHTGTGGSSVWDYTFASDLPAMSPEMGINLDDGISTVHLRDVLSYTLTYYNAGVVDATNVVLSMTLPSNTEYVGSYPAFHEEQPGIYWLDLPIVELESEANATFLVRVLEGGNPLPETIDARASIWDDGASGADPYLYNNHDEDVDQIEYGEMALNITKEAVPDAGTEVAPGSLITYTIRYENVGYRPCTQGVLTDTYDGQGDYVIVSTDPDPDEGNNIWEVGTLGLYDSGAIQIVVRLNDVLPDGWPITNTATIGCAEGKKWQSEVLVHTVAVPPTTPLVDLTVSDITWWPEVLTAKRPAKFWAEIDNIGEIDADESFWVELYIKPAPSVPPEGAWDHDFGYCLNDCAVKRPNYVQLIDHLDQGEVFQVPFQGNDVRFAQSGDYDLYAYVDVAFDSEEFNLFWGIYPERDETNNYWHEQVYVKPPTVYLPMVFKKHK